MDFRCDSTARSAARLAAVASYLQLLKARGHRDGGDVAASPVGNPARLTTSQPGAGRQLLHRLDMGRPGCAPSMLTPLTDQVAGVPATLARPSTGTMIKRPFLPR